MTGVLDFGIGNIASILNMIECVHGKGMAVHTAEELALCKRLILPGVGAFDAGMSLLNLSGMRNALDKAVANGIPLLGICLGMQMLGLSSEEGDAQGLGYIPFRLLSWLVLHSFHQTERARKAICAMIFSGIASEVFMVIAYFGYEAVIMGTGLGAAAGIPGNIGQGICGIIVSCILTPALSRIRVFGRRVEELRK